jgi:hypothetical protein
MPKMSHLLTIAALLLGLASTGASASPANGPRVVGTPERVDLVQYDGGRCFNRCVSGRIFRRCQSVEVDEKETCCNSVCNRNTNWYYNSRWYYQEW